MAAHDEKSPCVSISTPDAWKAYIHLLSYHYIRHPIKVKWIIIRYIARSTYLFSKSLPRQSHSVYIIDSWGAWGFTHALSGHAYLCFTLFCKFDALRLALLISRADDETAECRELASWLTRRVIMPLRELPPFHGRWAVLPSIAIADGWQVILRINIAEKMWRGHFLGKWISRFCQNKVVII